MKIIPEISCIPIFTEENLSSIVISEIDLPTEATVFEDKEKFSETEKPETFSELYEKYDELFIKNTTTGIIIDNENPVQKRSSDDTPDDVSTKSLIDKIQIDDPEVRKEFENELKNQGQSLDDDKVIDDGAKEYDPNYSKKLIAAPDNTIEYDTQLNRDSENSIKEFKTDDVKADEEKTDDVVKKLTVHEKEVLQGHMVEQLVHMNESSVDYTTVIPEDSFRHHENIKNPEVVDVLEHIVYQSTNQELSEMTTVNPLNVQVDFDPIEIIPSDRHRFRNVDAEVTTESNDKFVGFKPTEDLVEPGEETTESDQFFKKVETEDETALKTVETIVDTLEFVGIYGKSFQFNNASDEGKESKSPDNDADVTTTETFTEEMTTVAPSIVESVTEIVEVRTEVSVTIQVGDKEADSSDESHKHSSSANKSESSEESNSDEKADKWVKDKDDSTGESNSSKSDEKADKRVKDKHDSSGESNSDKSDDKTDKREKDKDNSEDSNSSKSDEKTEKREKDKHDSSEENTAKEILDSDDLRILDLQNKDNQKSLMNDMYKETLNHEVKKKDHPEELSLPSEVVARTFSAEDKIAQHLEDKIKPAETTTVGVYETLGDVVSTMSDGIKLSNDFRASIDSFHGAAEENKTVLDTNSEAISSKNIKNSLVNIAEEMTLEDHVESSKISYLIVAAIGITSTIVIVILYAVLKIKSLRVIFT